MHGECEKVAQEKNGKAQVQKAAEAHSLGTTTEEIGSLESTSA